MFLEEIWKDISDYDGLYQVSNLGRVKSLDRVVEDVFLGRFRRRTFKGKILSQKSNKCYGYKEVTLHGLDRKHNTVKVHQLVAKAFIPNPNCFVEVNHKDEDVSNNHVENLEWCNHSYNTNYGSRNEKLRQKTLEQWNRQRMKV